MIENNNEKENDTMKSRRIISLLLALVMLFGMIVSVSAADTANSEKRHVTCTALSSQAISYYTGSYTYEKMSALQPGNTSCLSTVDSAMYKTLHNLMDSTMTRTVSYKGLYDWFHKSDSVNGSAGTYPVLFYADEIGTNYSDHNKVNREHVWPKSRASYQETRGGCDLHHLRPSDATINSTRSNHTMGNVKAHSTSYNTKAYNGKTVLWYDASYSKNGCDGLVEVNDNIKGDVARILLYVYVRWEEPNLFENDPSPKKGSNDPGGNDGKKVIESLDTLLQWCEIDPVDTWEMKRNDIAQNAQGNRNVFIDYPEFAWLLFNQNMPTDMTTPSGEAKKADPTPVYTFTAQSNNTAWGTVSISGSTITASPKTGYTVSESSAYRVSPAGAATVTRSGNTFTVSNLTANCTVTINFAPKSAATITYIVPDGVTASGITSAFVGDTVKLATVSGTPDGYTFVGWSKTHVDRTTAKPATVSAGSNYTLQTASNTFYAVFSYAEEGTTYYTSETTPVCRHQNTETTVIASTCVQSGSRRTVCTDCGAVISVIRLPLADHQFESTRVEPTCTQPGMEKSVCTVCGLSSEVTITALGHQYKGVVTTPATKTEAGVMTYACVRCGDSYTQAIPAEGSGLTFESFSDLDGAKWYAPGVKYVLTNGLMNGVGGDQFDPEGNVTRAMLVTILYRMEKSPAVAGIKNPFVDVPAGQWYTNAIIWAADRKIVNGVSDTEFAPNAPITREQIATILCRYEGAEKDTCDLSAYLDAGNVSNYANDAMQWAVKHGLINGVDGRLLPRENASRAQIATILMRYLSK